MQQGRHHTSTTCANLAGAASPALARKAGWNLQTWRGSSLVLRALIRGDPTPLAMPSNQRLASCLGPLQASMSAQRCCIRSALRLAEATRFTELGSAAAAYPYCTYLYKQYSSIKRRASEDGIWGLGFGIWDLELEAIDLQRRLS
ncbi:hypothetical protein TRIATDRAFT_160153 [Trichoderma atroviride IMI 206040]|uniref:Uncharacterized protein n=1 Tax=Hypocrea atroviridis (strain ATCC 20476 / IMI 206040) TaxID=452589 RepID=G9PBH2_HYPAI|nr:uncharacterized protein TRIATDRAFT_160153 [Trichoderma atroviride IMI 206040]EHK39866.1 hypothetical protein TRIATDRAFT_160153 [Trichoderma atroviride IMI 206040]